jgi:AcrR family transcriptional regulator
MVVSGMMARKTLQRAGGSPSRGIPKRAPEVLEAAVQIFAAKGYENASMQEIGETLGLLKGSIYYYTPSKENLLFAVIESVHAEMMSNLARAKARDGDVESRIRAFLEDMVSLTVDRLEHASVFQREFRHLAPKNQDEIRQERRQYEAFFQALLREGQQEGKVRTDVEPKILMIGGFTMINAIPTWYRRGGSLSKREIIANYVRLITSSYQMPEP